MSEAEGSDAVDVSTEDTIRLLQETEPDKSNSARTARTPGRSTMSKLAAILQLVLVLVLKVFGKFWKVCIAELLLIILVFWFYGGILTFVLMIVAILTILYNMQDFLLYFPDNPKMSTMFVPSAAILELPFENLLIKTSDRLKISAVLLKQPVLRMGRSPTIIFLHGNAGNLGHRLFNAKLLYAFCNSNVLLVDYRGYGKSEGLPSESGLYLDAQAALDYLHTRRDIDHTQIFMFGRSLGGAVAIHIASDKLNIGRLKGLIVENTFSCIQDMGKQLFSDAITWIPLCLVKNKYLSFRKVAAIHTPSLFLSGTADELVPPKMMKSLFMRCKAPRKTMICFQGGSHNETWQCENYFQVIRDFVRKEVSQGISTLDQSHHPEHHSHHASAVFTA